MRIGNHIQHNLLSISAEYYSSRNASLYDNKSNTRTDFRSEVKSGKFIFLNLHIPGFASNIVDVLNTVKRVDSLKSLACIDTLTATQNGNTMLADHHEMKSGGLFESFVDRSHEPELSLLNILSWERQTAEYS